MEKEYGGYIYPFNFYSHKRIRYYCVNGFLDELIKCYNTSNKYYYNRDYFIKHLSDNNFLFFRKACEYNQLEIDVSILNNKILKITCQNENIEIIKFFLSIKPIKIED